MTFKTTEEKNKWIAEYETKNMIAKAREETLVKEDDSWKVQENILKNIIHQADKLFTVEIVAHKKMEKMDTKCNVM